MGVRVRRASRGAYWFGPYRIYRSGKTHWSVRYWSHDGIRGEALLDCFRTKAEAVAFVRSEVTDEERSVSWPSPPEYQARKDAISKATGDEGR